MNNNQLNALTDILVYGEIQSSNFWALMKDRETRNNHTIVILLSIAGLMIVGSFVYMVITGDSQVVTDTATACAYCAR